MDDAAQGKGRSLAQEIKSFIARKVDLNNSWGGESDALEEILTVYLGIDELSVDSPLVPALQRYVVVALVAFIQSSVRTFVTDIIDEKELAGEQIPDLKNAKLTVELARELKNQSFSFGELIAHFLSYSSVDQIENAVKLVCDDGFISIVKKEFISYEIDGGPKITPEDLARDTRNGLQRLFHLRNIYCHEIGGSILPSPMEMVEFLRIGLVVSGSLARYRVEYTDGIRAKRTGGGF